MTKIWVYDWFFFLAITVDVFEHPHLHVLVFLYLIFITINTWGVFFFKIIVIKYFKKTIKMG